MLAEKLYELKSFKRQFDAILVLSVCSTIPELAWERDRKTLLDQIDWNNMIGIASALSYSDDYRHLDAALRISQTVLTEESTVQLQKRGSWRSAVEPDQQACNKTGN